MKKKHSILPYIIMVIIGVGCCLLLCERAEQVSKMELNQNEKINY
ncbi:MAG: hypothetical protein VZS44_09350 [Bacilli bacterium]|nr:hypothetical protein [Bacilli bacterium]